MAIFIFLTSPLQPKCVQSPSSAASWRFSATPGSSSNSVDEAGPRTLQSRRAQTTVLSGVTSIDCTTPGHSSLGTFPTRCITLVRGTAILPFTAVEKRMLPHTLAGKSERNQLRDGTTSGRRRRGLSLQNRQKTGSAEDNQETGMLHKYHSSPGGRYLEL